MLPNPSSLLLFVTGAIVVLIIPGPAVFYIVSRSIGQGRAAGLVSAVGITAGTLVHVAAATLGLSALLVSSALAFQFVKYAGAAYLVYLGVRVLWSEDGQMPQVRADEGRLARVFEQGVVVNVLNPKNALFFLAFLPQFIEPARGHITLQIFSLGLLFALMGWCSDSTWALLAGTLSERLRRSERWRRTQRRLSGCGLIALGVVSAFSGARSK